MQPNRKSQYLSAFSVSLAFIASGMTSGWPTPVILKFYNNETSVATTKTQISWMLGLNPIGFVVGSLSARFVMDILGRRITLLASILPVLIGTILTLFVKSGWYLIMTFILWSIGTGTCATVQGIYFAEIGDKDIRGKLSLTTRYAFNLGNLLVISIGPFISYEALNVSLLIAPIIFIVSWFWLPETPYYYLKEGRVDDARSVLVKLRGIKDDMELNSQLATIEKNVKEDMSRSSSIKQLFTGRNYRKAIIISAGIKLTSIMTGTVSIRQYLGMIVQEGHLPKHMEQTVMVIFGTVGFLMTIASSILVEKVGRRPLLIGSYLGTGISLTILGLYFFLQDFIKINISAVPYCGYLPFIIILLSTIFSTIGYNSIVNFMPSELFPLNVKAIAMSAYGIYSGLLGFILGKSYQDMKDTFGIYTVFWLFASFAFAGFVFSYYLVPETKDKNLTDIQAMLQCPWVDFRTRSVSKMADRDEDGEETSFIETKI